MLMHATTKQRPVFYRLLHARNLAVGVRIRNGNEEAVPVSIPPLVNHLYIPGVLVKVDEEVVVYHVKPVDRVLHEYVLLPTTTYE